MTRLWRVLSVSAGVCLTLLTAGWAAARPGYAKVPQRVFKSRPSLWSRCHKTLVRPYLREPGDGAGNLSVVQLLEWKQRHPLTPIHFAIATRATLIGGRGVRETAAKPVERGVVAAISQHRNRNSPPLFAADAGATNTILTRIADRRLQKSFGTAALTRLSAARRNASPKREDEDDEDPSSTPAKPARAPGRRVAQVSRQNVSSPGLRIAAEAMTLLGKPYVWGGASPQTGFDCSGLVQYVLSTTGISIPRTTWQQFSFGSPVSEQNLQPGDLLFFSTYASGPTHVGIYVGNSHFVNALNPDTGVILSNLSESYFAARYLGARCPWNSAG